MTTNLGPQFLTLISVPIGDIKTPKFRQHDFLTFKDDNSLVGVAQETYRDSMRYVSVAIKGCMNATFQTKTEDPGILGKVNVFFKNESSVTGEPSYYIQLLNNN